MSNLRRQISQAFDFWTRLLSGVALVLFLFVAVVDLPKWQIQRDLDTGRISWSDVPQQENAYRKILIQIAGGCVVAIGLYLTWRRIQATEEAQVTDRFSKAIEQLGNQSLEVRLGGIYALERIAEDSPKDHWTVMETLCAFVRENASSSVRRDLRGTEGEKKTENPAPNASPGTDVEAACIAIGRRRSYQDPNKTLNLSGALLAGITLTGADLAGVFLEGADLSGANLYGIDLSESYLLNTNLVEADLKGADLSAANLRDANLSEAHLDGADLSHAHLDVPDGSFHLVSTESKPILERLVLHVGGM
jgi:hypothetical protein